ncbi:MAG: RNA 2',3'-cyclic phosphodiesterase [Balneolales bacterium]
MNRKRLFIAIPLSENLKDLLYEKFKEYELPGKLTPRENLHITVHFLGETEEEDVLQIEEQIASITEDTPGFILETDKIILKKGRFHQMLWVKIHPSDPFIQLVQNLRDIFEPDKTHMKILPHITLSRLKKAKERVREEGFPINIEDQVIEVSRVELWQSKMGGKNPVYELLKGFHLQ